MKWLVSALWIFLYAHPPFDWVTAVVAAAAVAGAVAQMWREWQRRR